MDINNTTTIQNLTTMATDISNKYINKNNQLEVLFVVVLILAVILSWEQIIKFIKNYVIALILVIVLIVILLSLNIIRIG